MINNTLSLPCRRRRDARLANSPGEHDPPRPDRSGQPENVIPDEGHHTSLGCFVL